MKTNIKARITCLNKCEKNLEYNFYFRQTATSFFLFLFYPFPFTLFLFFFPTVFVLILSYLSGTCTLFFVEYLGGTFSPLLDISDLSGTFSPGGGGAHAPSAPPPPPRVRACHIEMCNVSCYFFRSDRFYKPSLCALS